MTNKSTSLLIIILLICFSSKGQQQANLTAFVKLPVSAISTIDEIDTLSKILITKFLITANDNKSISHKEIQSFFEDFKSSDENTENNIYPAKLVKDQLTIQYIEYSTSYGFVGHGADSVFNQSELVALVFIPAFDIFHKGKGVNTICFKVSFRVYTESAIDSDKDYKREEKLMEVKMLDL